jgi:hypothetical protein
VHRPRNFVKLLLKEGKKHPLFPIKTVGKSDEKRNKYGASLPYEMKGIKLGTGV